MNDRPERVLVGIDEHDASVRAVQWVAARAGSRRLCVRLLDVTDGSDLDPVLMDARLTQLRRRILQVDPDAEVRVETRYGDVVGVLLDEASDADLLVIGSRRSQPVRSALEGWLAERIPTRAALPTVVVPEDWRSNVGDVLVGVDDESATTALDFAAEEAARSHRRLGMLRAWRLPVPTATRMLSALEDPPSYQDHNRRILDDAVRAIQTRHPHLRFRSILVEGDAGAAIEQHAATASLVVLGRRHRTTMGGALAGSVAHDLINGSSTPVCIVPPRRG